MAQPATFVLVHGANLGGWCWQDVQTVLEAHGHEVICPSLDLSLTASLDRHIADVAELIVSRDLQGIVLVGHSYGGMVITGVADRLRDRVARLVYLDAAVPGDGDDFASHIPGLSAAEVEERRAFYRSLSADGLWLASPPLQWVGITDAEAIATITPRLVPHPLATWLQPVRFQNGGPAGLPKTYILATTPHRSDGLSPPRRSRQTRRRMDLPRNPSRPRPHAVRPNRNGRPAAGSGHER